jgi:hypothetical protein
MGLQQAANATIQRTMRDRSRAPELDCRQARAEDEITNVAWG